MILLKQVEERRARRRLRLIEILLIIIRMLIIAFTVLALSRPYVHPPGGAPPRDVVIIVDNSASMAYADGSRERYTAALEAAKDYVKSLNEADRVAVVFAGGGGKFDLTAPVEAAKVLDAPPGLEPLRTYVPALTEATAILDGSDRIREIDMFCDMQLGHFAGLRAFSPAGYRINVRDIRKSPGPYGNLALAEITARPTADGFSIKALAKGYGDFGPATLRVNAGGTEKKIAVGDASLSTAYFTVPGGPVEITISDETGYRFDDAVAIKLPEDPSVSYYVGADCPGAIYFTTAFEVLGARPAMEPGAPGGPTVVVGSDYKPEDDLKGVVLIVPNGTAGPVGPAEWGLEITGSVAYVGYATAKPPLYDTASAGPIPVSSYYAAAYETTWEPVITLPEETPVCLKRTYDETETYVLLLPTAGDKSTFPRAAVFVTFIGDLLGRSLELAYPEFDRFTDLSLDESNVKTADADTLKKAFPAAELREADTGRGGWSFSLAFPFAVAVLLLLAAEAIVAAYVTRTTG